MFCELVMVYCQRAKFKLKRFSEFLLGTLKIFIHCKATIIKSSTRECLQRYAIFQIVELFHKLRVLLFVEPGVPLYLTGNPNEEDFSRLVLQWQPPRDLNGDIQKYRIHYSRNASDHKWKYVDVNGTELRKEISGLKAGTTYYFKMQARTKKGWGVISTVMKIATLSGN